MTSWFCNLWGITQYLGPSGEKGIMVCLHSQMPTLGFEFGLTRSKTLAPSPKKIIKQVPAGFNIP